MSADQKLTIERNTDHYDHITDMWQLLLGQNFHWGYFNDGSQSLEKATDRLIDVLVAPLQLDCGSTLLDVGCGIGHPAKYLSDKYGCSITGISTSKQGIKEASKLSEYYSKLQFCEKNALNNNFEDESFSSVMLMEMSHLVQDKTLLIHESARVLEIGGVLSLCDLTLHRKLAAKEIVSMYEELRLLEKSFGKARLETLSAYCSILESCGLEVITVSDISKEVIPTIQCWKDNALANFQKLKGYVSETEINLFLKSCDILDNQYRNGAWGYGLVAGRKTSATTPNLPTSSYGRLY